ncbi:hypothetical protein IFM89_021881, partial [Coptis chinensis]
IMGLGVYMWWDTGLSPRIEGLSYSATSLYRDVSVNVLPINSIYHLHMLGVKRIERALPIGTSLTVVGEAVKDDIGTILIQRPYKGPFYVSPKSIDQLIANLGIWSSYRFYKYASMGFTVVGVFLIAKHTIRYIMERRLRYDLQRRQSEEMGLVSKNSYPFSNLRNLVMGEEGLVHFQWLDRTRNVVEDDQIIFPDEAVFEKISESSGRVFLLKFNTDNRRFFFWMQEPKADGDHQICVSVNHHMNQPLDVAGEGEPEASVPLPELSDDVAEDDISSRPSARLQRILQSPL